MAPRKTTKTSPEAQPAPAEAAAVPKAPKTPKAPARSRARKAAEEVPAVPAPELPAPEAEAPVRARKPRTATPKSASKAASKPSKASKAPAAQAPEPVAVEPLPEVQAAPAPAPAPQAASALPPQAQAVLQGIQAGKAVELIFVDGESNPPRTFEPRQLLFEALGQAWYVWGWDRRYNAERHHRLDLIAQVNPVEGVGRAAQGPYKEDTPANHIGGWLGGEPIRVKATLLKQWIFAVRQAPAPFPDFRIEDLEEGKAQVTFTATDLRAIARWVMQFGDGIQVIEPQRLVDRVKQVGIAWGGKPAPAPTPAPAKAAQPRQERSERPERAERAERAERPDRSEHRSESAERRRSEAPRHNREAQDAKPSKPAKVEIRFDRL